MSKFKELWKNYPKKTAIQVKCQNKQNNGSRPFGNYCAIMLSEAFITSGVSTLTFKGRKCWSHPGIKHILLAEEMATWINQSKFSWAGKVEKISPKEFQDQLGEKTGIIFFKDYWQRNNESFQNRSGDHIDLWNKDELTGGSMLSRNIYEFFGLVSDLNKSKEIWFWEVK